MVESRRYVRKVWWHSAVEPQTHLGSYFMVTSNAEHMATGERDTTFGIEQMELSMIIVGAIIVTAFSWVANDVTGTLRIASAGFTGLVSFVVAVYVVRQLN